MTAPVLVLAFGNPSRGDDAVGPILHEYLSQYLLPDIELLTDFQLQVEHILDLQRRKLVLFIDAGVNLPAPVCIQQIRASAAVSVSTHALEPSQLLACYTQVLGEAAPVSFLLALEGSAFELGSSLSAAMQSNYKQACQLLLQMLHNPSIDYWSTLTTT